MKSLIRVAVAIALSGVVTLFATACGGGGGGGGGGTPAEPPPELTDNTVVLEDSTTQYLSSISPDGATFSFSQSTPQLDSLAPGDIIVSDPTSAAPYGFLRKVVSPARNVAPSGGIVHAAAEVYIVETIEATLEDAIEQASVEFQTSLTPEDIQPETVLPHGLTLNSMSPQQVHDFNFDLTDVVLYDDDGNLLTRDDQIRANGYIAFDIDIDFNFEIDHGSLEHLEFVVTLANEAQLEVASQISLLDVGEKIALLPVPIYFTPIVVVVPVVHPRSQDVFKRHLG